MKRRLTGVLAAAALMLGILAPGALASVTGVAVLADPETGIAAVGNEWEGNERCSKTGGVADGTGLLITPSTNDPHTWSLRSTFTLAGVANGEPGIYTGLFNVCGWMMGTVPPLGASCLTTKGYRGVGQAVSTSGPSSFSLKLFDIGWKAAVGPILPITGNYEEYDGGEKSGKRGAIIGLVGAAPSPIAPPVLPCIGTDEAKDFQIAGAVALVNGGSVDEKPTEGPIWAKSCGDKDHPDEDCPSRKPRP